MLCLIFSTMIFDSKSPACFPFLKTIIYRIENNAKNHVFLYFMNNQTRTHSKLYQQPYFLRLNWVKYTDLTSMPILRMSLFDRFRPQKKKLGP